MNRIYRSIWNNKTGTFVAASENVKGAGKRSSSGTSPASGRVRFALKGLAVSLMLAFGGQVYALPTGGVVSAGSAGIASGTGVMTVNQASQNVAINWQGFNIGSGEAVRFVQPNSSSIALNRVLGSDPSSILGSLSANGKVFLVNPNGILFGQGAAVNVGGLVASTLNISDSDFMAGNYNFSGAGKGTVENQGAINADGGYVALLGANVSNQGVISARLGTVALAAGNAVTLDLAGDGLLNVAVSQGAVNALVDNGGLIRADGGQVLLTAQAAGGLLQSAVNNTGVIEAQTLQNHNGTIRLLGDMQSGTVNVGGTLDVSGRSAGQTGGSVTVTAQHVGLFGGHIDASGDAGGGTVLVGGDLHGASSAVQNATATYVSNDSTIAADAVTNGNGGKVVVWSDNTTRYYGSISARGGANSGDGGFVETSGKQYLDFSGSVDTLASAGNAGTLLLDPSDITISGAIDTGMSGLTSPFSGTTNTSNLNDVTLTNALATGNVLVDATAGAAAGSGNITVSTVITWATANTLELKSGKDLVVNAAMNANTAGAGIKLTAVHDVTINGALSANGAAATITASAGNNVNVNAVLSANGAGSVVNLHADNDCNRSGTVTFGAGGSVTASTPTTNIYYNPTGNDYTRWAADKTTYSAVVPGLLNLYMLLPVTGLSANKTYDGTTTATLTGTATIAPLASDHVVLGGVGSVTNFSTANVHTENLTLSGYTISGGNAAHYSLCQPCTLAASITAAPVVLVPLAVTASNVSKPYGQTAVLSAFTSTGLVGGQTIGSVTLTSAGTPATASVGPYAITASNATGGTFIPSDYSISYANGVLTVTPVVLTVTAGNLSKNYGQTATPTAFTAAGLVNGDTVTGVTETSPGAAATAGIAGSPYAITPSSATGSFVASNYTVAYVNGALTVVPVALTVTASDVTKSYGQTPTLSAFTAAGLVNGDTIGSVTETSPGQAATASVAGSAYAITPSAATGGSFVPGNYTVAYVNGALTVVPVALTVTASDVTKIYGQTPTLNAFNTSGLANGDTITSVTETSPGQPATASVAGSPYVITPSAATGSFVPANYTIAYVNGVLKVITAPLTIAAPDVTISYGQTPVLSTFTPTGLLNGDTVGSVTGTSPGTLANASSAGGSYAINSNAATGGTFTPSNYSIGYVDGTLMVTPAIVPSETVPTVPGESSANSWMPGIVLAAPPAQLLTVASAAAPVEAPPPVVQEQAPIVVPAEVPRKPYVAPRRPRKQDLN